MFFETTIMGNTADLAMVQKTIIDTLHKEGKSQRIITERCGFSRSAVSKHVRCKVDWKEEIGKENVHKQQGWPQAWEYCQAKPIQTLGRASQGVNWSWSQCIKSHHAQTSSGKELPNHFWNRNIIRSILSGLRRKRTGLLLSGPKSSFQMKVHFAFSLEIKVPESGGRVKRQNPCCLKSSVKFPVSDDLGCHVICWCCLSIVFSEVHSLCQEEDERHQTQQCRRSEGRYQSILGFITPEQCHRLITFMTCHIDAVIHAKGSPTKYWVHRNEHTFQKPDISV